MEIDKIVCLTNMIMTFDFVIYNILVHLLVCDQKWCVGEALLLKCHMLHQAPKVDIVQQLAWREVHIQIAGVAKMLHAVFSRSPKTA